MILSICMKGHSGERMKSILVFIDGTICDDRQRLNLLGTDDFNLNENILKDIPVSGSVEFLNNVSKNYQIIYIGARLPQLLGVTVQWLKEQGFPDGKIYLAPTQNERIKIVQEELIKENITVGIGDRWDDNQLHLILGCKSIIVQEYHADWDFVEKYL